MRNRLKNGIALSILPQILLVKWIGNYPGIIETYYSKGFYPYWSGFFRSLLGWLPFSIGDFLYGFLLLWLAYYLIKKRGQLFKDWKVLLRDMVMVFSIAYFTFHLSWGFNYYREPVSDYFSLSENYSSQDLYRVTKALIRTTNELQLKITADSTAAVQIPYTQNEIFDKTIDAYSHLADTYPQFRYTRPSLKKSGFSTLLTYMGYGGYLNPFTHESQVNSKIPNFRFPVVCGHEVGHQLGYSAENEVNFIGYLVMASHRDDFLRYTAYAYALSHCLREVKKRQPEKYKTLFRTVNPGVRENYEALNKFWESYANPLEPVFKSVFNIFLKANNQKAGIKSYNLAVTLIIGYHLKNPL